MTGSLAICISYRYRQLAVFETHRLYRLIVKDAGRGDFAGFYILSPILLTYLTYIGLTTDEEARILILKV